MSHIPVDDSENVDEVVELEVVELHGAKEHADLDLNLLPNAICGHYELLLQLLDQLVRYGVRLISKASRRIRRRRSRDDLFVCHCLWCVVAGGRRWRR